MSVSVVRLTERPAVRPARPSLVAFAVAAAGALTLAFAQTLPDPDLPVLDPAALALVCPERTWTTLPTAEELARAASRDAYRAVLPDYLARLPGEPDAVLWMPVDGVREGMAVTPDTVLGYVGTDGNAAGTPPHLHFGAYAFDPETCRHRAFDPLPMMVDRTREAAR